MKALSRLFAAAFVLLTLIAGTLSSQEDVRKFNLKNIDWLVGHWQGPGFGGICEEVWQPETAGSMVGTFKLSVKGAPQFYEMMVITIDSTGPALRLKHFNSDLTGWEEKDQVVTFEFESAGKNEVTFGATTYKLVGEDSLHIMVKVKSGDGTIQTETISCNKIKE
jgi:hypothetical protein